MKMLHGVNALNMWLTGWKVPNGHNSALTAPSEEYFPSSASCWTGVAEPPVQ